MDDGDVGRDEDAAVFPGGAEREGMVILIDGPAHRAQAVVAVGHHVWNRKLPHPAGPRRLDDANIGDVMRREAVKGDPQRLRVPAPAVGTEHVPGDAAFPSLLRRKGLPLGQGAGLGRAEDAGAVKQEGPVVDQSHRMPPHSFMGLIWRTTSRMVPSLASMMATTRS